MFSQEQILIINLKIAIVQRKFYLCRVTQGDHGKYNSDYGMSRSLAFLATNFANGNIALGARSLPESRETSLY